MKGNEGAKGPKGPKIMGSPGQLILLCKNAIFDGGPGNLWGGTPRARFEKAKMQGNHGPRGHNKRKQRPKRPK